MTVEYSGEGDTLVQGRGYFTKGGGTTRARTKEGLP